MIEWRNIYGSETWLKGENGKKGSRFRSYQIIYREHGNIFDGMPRDELWELCSYGGGNPSLKTTHKTIEEAMSFAEKGC